MTMTPYERVLRRMDRRETMPALIRPSPKNRVVCEWEQGTVLHFRPTDPLSQLRKAERVSRRANRDLRFGGIWTAIGARDEGDHVFINVDPKNEATGFLISGARCLSRPCVGCGEDDDLDFERIFPEARVPTVSIIWTKAACRRRGIARRLFETARDCGGPGSWAIQPPLSELGKSFARQIFGARVLYAW